MRLSVRGRAHRVTLPVVVGEWVGVGWYWRLQRCALIGVTRADCDVLDSFGDGADFAIRVWPDSNFVEILVEPDAAGLGV